MRVGNDTALAKDKYESRLGLLKEDVPRYHAAMTAEFAKCQDFEQTRVDFMKRVMAQYHGIVALTHGDTFEVLAAGIRVSPVMLCCVVCRVVCWVVLRAVLCLALCCVLCCVVCCVQQGCISCCVVYRVALCAVLCIVLRCVVLCCAVLCCVVFGKVERHGTNRLC